MSVVTFGAGADVNWNIHSSPTSGTGRRSARWATGGDGLTLLRFRWVGVFKNGSATGSASRPLFLYAIESSDDTGAAWQGQSDETEGVATSRINLPPIGSVACDLTTANAIYRGSDVFETYAPFLQLQHFNDFGVDLNSTSGSHWVTLERVA